MTTNEITHLTDEDLFDQCVHNFSAIAGIQGRVAYLLMSIHAVNPNIWHRFSNFDPSHVLFSNMVYGTAVNVFSRSAMKPISFLNRLIFSVLGSAMFNYSSMLVYEFLRNKLEHRPILLTVLGFLSGRMMMLHFLAYLYHVDRFSRVERNLPRNAAFDSTDKGGRVLCAVLNRLITGDALFSVEMTLIPSLNPHIFNTEIDVQNLLHK